MKNGICSASGGVGGFLSGMLGFATGGYVRGPGTETSDSIVAKLSRGEFVVKASSVRALGLDTLNYINRHGTLPRFATGGLVDGGLGLNGSTTVQNSISPNVVISTAQLIEGLKADPAFERYATEVVVRNGTRIRSAWG